MIGLESYFLFAHINNGNPLTLKSIRKYKTSIEKASGVRFQLKDLRSTYATITYSAALELFVGITSLMDYFNVGGASMDPMYLGNLFVGLLVVFALAHKSVYRYCFKKDTEQASE